MTLSRSRTGVGPPWSQPVRVLRRLEWTAAAYGFCGAALLLVWGSAGGALVLTLAAAASIVSFRGLQGLVGSFQAGAERPGQRTSSDRRSRRFVWLRFCLLLLAPLVSLWLDSERALALVLGFSVLPLAIMTEGVIQLVFVLVNRDHGD